MHFGLKKNLTDDFSIRVLFSSQSIILLHVRFFFLTFKVVLLKSVINAAS